MFQSGPVHSKLMQAVKSFQRRVRKEVGAALYDDRGHWNSSLEEMWISALCRILIGIQKYHHGGAVLISDVGTGLNQKYSLRYDRLANALFRAAVHSIKNTSYSDLICEKYLDEEADEIPTGLYLDDACSQSELTDTNNEITGCVRFLASLSRIDGLIWLDSSLKLKAFGVEITIGHDPVRAFLAQDSRAKKTKKLDLNHFGTRHRSMLRYCGTNPDSLGFVVSQDGDVRAITQFDDCVLLWDNVRIQSLLNARSVSAE